MSSHDRAIANGPGRGRAAALPSSNYFSPRLGGLLSPSAPTRPLELRLLSIGPARHSGRSQHVAFEPVLTDRGACRGLPRHLQVSARGRHEGPLGMLVPRDSLPTGAGAVALQRSPDRCRPRGPQPRGRQPDPGRCARQTRSGRSLSVPVARGVARTTVLRRCDPAGEAETARKHRTRKREHRRYPRNRRRDLSAAQSEARGHLGRHHPQASGSTSVDHTFVSTRIHTRETRIASTAGQTS